MITSYDKNDVSQVKAVKVFQKFRNDNGKKRIGLMGNMESGFNLGDNSATVVAVIGKSSIEKNQLLNLLVDRPVFGIPSVATKQYEEKRLSTSKLGTFIEAYHDLTTNTIYLNHTSALDKATILDVFQNEDEKIYELITNEEYLELQCFLFLFLVSNIVLVLQSSLSIDTEWISIFKLLGNLKKSIQSDLKAFIKKSFLNSTTITSEILENQFSPVNSVPIISCIFPLKNLPKFDYKKDKISKRDFLFQLHSSLEHQVKGILRKCKNNGCKDLYNLDTSQCAHVVILGNDINQNTYDLIMGNVSTETDKKYGIKQLKSWIQQKHKLFTQKVTDQHQIFNKGKERYVKASTLENQQCLLNSKTWFFITERVRYYLLEEIVENPLDWKGMNETDVDYLFSKECCLNAKNIAKSVYFYDLPEIYGEEMHQKRVKKATKVYKSLARGVASGAFEKELINELEETFNK